MFKKVVIFIVVVIIVGYVIPTVLMIIHMNDKINEKVDYLIVLGAKVNGNTPTKSLQYRLDEAIKYYEKYPNTIIVVSGAKGEDEIVTEASAMKEYLINNSVLEKNILLEDKSTTTYENLLNSKKVIDKYSKDVSKQKIGVISNNFHIYRAKMICERLFIQRCQMQAAPNYDGYQGFYSIVREPLAIYKSWLLDK